MVNIKSNASELAQKYSMLQNKLSENAQVISQLVAEEVSKDIKLAITSSSIWRESTGTMSEQYGDDVQVEVSGNSAIVKVGENTQPIIMNDGSQVNPYFFIEFGFGILGGSSPAPNSSNYDWNYNINQHSEPWLIPNTDVYSSGTVGINFIYNIVYGNKQKYSKIVKDYLMEDL